MLRPDTAVPDYANLTDIVDATAEFHRNFSNQRAAEILENRQELFEWIRKFHEECGTLAPRNPTLLQSLTPVESSGIRP